MIYDGVVVKINKLLFLFILNPDTNEMMDGINISEHQCYKNLTDENLMVVQVEFKDGTLTIDNIDLDEFVHGDSYGRNDIFIYIKDILLFTINNDIKNNISTLKYLIDNGDLNDVAIQCINDSKNNNI